MTNKIKAIIYAVMAAASLAASLIFVILHSRNVFFVIGKTVLFLLFAIFLIFAGYFYSQNHDGHRK